eukprot:CAMPEP_0171174576 /NCGR_PEP_ID=MMETSP0790-20130122/10797_1 /TAXON_ID=2925 /ORGANISM="Alexandrium catenella, Strain OF101" /LENGTH=501 /DNA_ID=CAMNT_0011639451 /DNA_START=92 /DNA_END=1597 /DNA_ORIENTATION=+
MALIITTLVALWRTFNVEVVIFLLTLTFSFAFRGMSSKVAVAKPSKAKLGKGLKGDIGNCPSDDQGGLQPRRAPNSGPRSIPYTAGAEQLPKAGIGSTTTKQKRPARIVDEVADGLRQQPGTRFAAKAFDVYSELREQLRRDSLRLPEAMRGSRHAPIDFYSAVVHSVVRTGQCHLIEEIMDDMADQGVTRPLSFYESTMKQLAGQKQYHLALSVYDRLAADGLEPSAVTCSCLISFAVEIGELQRALGFFEKLSSFTTPSIRAYMTVLRVYGRRQDWDASIATFRDMQRRRVHVDSLVLNVVLATCVSADQLTVAEGLLAEADECIRPITDVVSYNTVAKCYAQHNDLDGARAVIQRIQRRGLKPNAITFNSVMDAAVRSRRTSEAWDVLKDMRGAGLRPDKYSCSILIKGLSHDPTPVEVQHAEVMPTDVPGALDKSLRTTLFHSVIEAAAQVGDSSMLRNVFAHTKQHEVMPTAATYKRMRELAEARGTPLLRRASVY